MKDVRVDLNESAILSLGIDPEVRTMVNQRATALARRVAQDAPVQTGAFKESIGVRHNEEHEGQAAALVTTSDRAWHIIEFGSMAQTPRAPFRRAIQALGFKFVDRGGR